MRSEQDSPRRILHITEAMGAGVSTALFDYVHNTSEFEHHLLYVPRDETEALGTAWSAAFESVGQLPAGHRQRIQAVAERVRQLRPDVVHAHSSYAGFYSRLAVSKSRTLKQVYTPHCYAFERQDLAAPLRLALRAIEWGLAFNTTVIAACSPREARLSRHWPGSPQLSYIPNAAIEIGTADTAPDSVSVHTETLAVAGAGRLGPQKDPEFFLASIEALRERGYQVKASWLGGGDQSSTTKLEEAGIEVTGWIPRAELLQRLAAQDIYLHTAAWEGFPLAILEAAALRVATVVRDIPAFTGIDLPLRIKAPKELPALWDSLRDPFYRAEAVADSRAALSGNNAEAQREALLKVYRNHTKKTVQSGNLGARV